MIPKIFLAAYVSMRVPDSFSRASVARPASHMLADNGGLEVALGATAPMVALPNAGREQPAVRMNAGPIRSATRKLVNVSLFLTSFLSFAARSDSSCGEYK
jgi:hypothetical protein